MPNFSAPGHTEGTCTCIDGTTYTINGDDHGNCSVSCENGIIGDTCVLRDPVSLWPRKSVVCGPTLSHKDGPNVIVRWSETAVNRPVGIGGGTCTCSDGSIYPVADNNDDCSTLACVGGVPSESCSVNPGNWSFRKVLCGNITTYDADTNDIIPSEEVELPGAGGGSCTCVDGAVTQVAMEENTGGGCSSGLFCRGGIPGTCDPLVGIKYVPINTSNCVDLGYDAIESEEECETAAGMVGAQRVSAVMTFEIMRNGEIPKVRTPVDGMSCGYRDGIRTVKECKVACSRSANCTEMFADENGMCCMIKSSDLGQGWQQKQNQSNGTYFKKRIRQSGPVINMCPDDFPYAYRSLVHNEYDFDGCCAAGPPLLPLFPPGTACIRARLC